MLNNLLITSSVEITSIEIKPNYDGGQVTLRANIYPLKIVSNAHSTLVLSFPLSQKASEILMEELGKQVKVQVEDWGKGDNKI